MPSLTKFCIPLLFLCSVIACQEPESKQSLASGQIGQHQLDSEILGRTVDYQIYQPSGESEGIIYLLHGHGGDHNDWFESGEGHVSTIMDSLISNDVIPPMHAVSADMGNSWYVNRSYPAQDFYLDEFMAHIETSYLDDQVKIRLLAGTVIDCTMTTATPRPKAVSIFFDTARKVHMPRKKASAKFSTKMTLTKRLR